MPFQEAKGRSPNSPSSGRNSGNVRALNLAPAFIPFQSTLNGIANLVTTLTRNALYMYESIVSSTIWSDVAKPLSSKDLLDRTKASDLPGDGLEHCLDRNS